MTNELYSLLKFKKYKLSNERLNLIWVILRLVRELSKFPFLGKSLNKINGDLAFYNTQNQKKSLELLELLGVSMVSFNKSISANIHLPLARMILAQSLKVCFILYKRNSLMCFLKNRNTLVNIIIFLAVYSVFKETYMNEKRSYAIWLSNDHSSIHLAILAAFNRMGFTTKYLQHAHVTEIFPCLHFNKAYLDGEVAKRNYKYSKRTDLKITGPLRFYNKFKNIEKQNHLILATSPHDANSKITQIVKDLLLISWIEKVIIKPHPRQKSINLSEDLISKKIKILDCHEPTINLLWESRVLIASDSSIHLEAALTNNICYYYPSGAVQNDYYGFLKYGLVRPYSIEEIKKIPKTRTGQEKKALHLYFADVDNILKGSKRLESYF